MSETKIIGITAVVSSGLAVLLLVGMLAPMLSLRLTPHQESTSFTLYSSGYEVIDSTFEKDERWVIDFDSTYSIYAYLLTDSQYNNFAYYGSLYDYLSYDYGTSGHIDYTVTSNGNYHVVFDASTTTSVYVTTTEYHFS